MKFQTLDGWLSWLESLHPVAIDLGLTRVRAVGERLGALKPNVPVVTVAGTNGKGSVTAVLDALLRAQGLRTALYTSPHISRFNERIRINGTDIDDASLMQAFAQIDAVRGDISLTYFEFTTLAAFVIFAQKNVDAWILEVGLGGRLDAVNIIDADVAVLTSVGMDHMDYLGHTLEDIGREKAGIFRARHPVVLGAVEMPASVEAAITALAVPAFRTGEAFSATLRPEHYFDWQGRASDGSARALKNLPQPALALPNVATALQVLHLLPFSIDVAAVTQALRTVQLPGRNQLLQVGDRAVVLDVGHNPPALAFLRAELARHALGDRFHVVLGMLADKDIAGAVRELEPLAQSWHIAPLPGPRGASLAQLQAGIAANGSKAEVLPASSVALALRAALACDDGLPVLVVGSFYTVSAASTVLTH